MNKHVRYQSTCTLCRSSSDCGKPARHICSQGSILQQNYHTGSQTWITLYLPIFKTKAQLKICKENSTKWKANNFLEISRHTTHRHVWRRTDNVWCVYTITTTETASDGCSAFTINLQKSRADWHLQNKICRCSASEERKRNKRDDRSWKEEGRLGKHAISVILRNRASRGTVAREPEIWQQESYL